MKKFADSLVLIILVFFLCSSQLWAGDAEMSPEPQDESLSLPLTIPGEDLVSVPETVQPAEAPEEVVAEPAPAIEVERAVQKAEEPAVKAAKEMEEPEVAAKAVKEVAPPVVVPPPPALKDNLTIAAELIDQKGLENYKEALNLCMEAAKKDPHSFKANWMAAKCCRLYGMETQELGLSDWKDTCKLYGKKGMAYADKAIKLNSKKADGYFWYGMNVGIYADSVSILTALREGLKDKTQNSFETAYKIDKYYDKAGPIGALGRFWQVLPWPLNDDDKSMDYYREFQKTKFFATPDTVQVNVYFAELLMDSRKTKKEAKALLEQVPQLSKKKYWRNKAQVLLDDM